jgi:opacity protein-like surface antigen
MKKEVLRSSRLVFLFVMVISLSTYAQDPSQLSDDWEIRLMPYFWMPSLDAEGTVGGPLGGSLSGNVDLSFGDVLDYLNFTAMGRIEAWNGKWGLTFDGLFMNLGADGSFQGSRGLTNFSLDADVRLGMADFGLAYRLYDQQFGKNNAQRLAFEPYGGLRYAYLKEKIDLNINIAGVGSVGGTLGTSEDWVEPFVGGRVVWDLHDKWSLNIRGDAGGFGIGSASDLTWQILGGVDYKLSKNTIFNAGYRYVELDYSHGSGSDKLGIDLRAKGPYLGLTITF